MLEGSGHQMGTGQGRAHSRPLPGRASLCIPPSSKAAEECVFTEEKQARLRDSGQGPRAAPQRPLPSPLVHIQGQGKPIQSDARLSNHRGLWARPGMYRKQDGIQVPRPPAPWAAPPSSQCVASSRPFSWTFALVPAASPAHPGRWGGQERAGGRWSSGQPPATAAGTGPVLLSSKGADRT